MTGLQTANWPNDVNYRSSDLLRSRLSIHLAASESGHVHCWRLLKPIIHANEEVLQVRLCGESVGCADAHSADLPCTATRTEAHEVVFKKGGPVREEHPFSAATNCPTGPIASGYLSNLNSERVVCSHAP